MPSTGMPGVRTRQGTLPEALLENVAASQIRNWRIEMITRIVGTTLVVVYCAFALTILLMVMGLERIGWKESK